MTPDDQLVTEEREELRKLYTRIGIVPMAREEFQCSKLRCCAAAAKRELITGTWAYVGTDYGKARVAGRNVKVLFVAMDSGGKKEDVGQAFEVAQYGFRWGAENPKNSHMGGVQLLLRELVDDKDPNVFSRQFALTNAVKCRKLTEMMETGCPAKMVKNCAGHLEKEIELVKPALIISQGGHPSRTLKKSQRFAGRAPLATFTAEARGLAAEVLRVHDGTILVTTPHPRGVKGLRWRQGELPSFLLKAVDRARRELTITG